MYSKYCSIFILGKHRVPVEVSFGNSVTGFRCSEQVDGRPGPLLSYLLSIQETCRFSISLDLAASDSTVSLCCVSVGYTGLFYSKIYCSVFDELSNPCHNRSVPCATSMQWDSVRNFSTTTRVYCMSCIGNSSDSLESFQHPQKGYIRRRPESQGEPIVTFGRKSPKGLSATFPAQILPQSPCFDQHLDVGGFLSTEFPANERN